MFFLPFHSRSSGMQICQSWPLAEGWNLPLKDERTKNRGSSDLPDLHEQELTFFLS